MNMISTIGKNHYKNQPRLFYENFTTLLKNKYNKHIIIIGILK